MKVAHAHPAAIAPSVLVWAIRRAGMSSTDLAAAMHTSEAVVTTWLDGKRQPSFRQAATLAKKLRLPFGFLFLPAPPPEDLPIPNFRTVGGQPVNRISLDLREVILGAMRRQSWLSDYRRELGEEPLNFVGSASASTPATAIAAIIRETLGLGSAAPPIGAEEFMRFLVERAEAAGIGVLRSGIVGMNTSRKLDVDEFRGFALADAYAPLVFINSTDVKVAQAFTLIHELTHIWRGQSGISGSLQEESRDETLCNKVAAEAFVPAQAFAQHWDATDSDVDAIAAASKRFRVSRFVIAIRAWESGFISRERLNELLHQYRSDARAAQGAGGGDFYRNTIVRNGRVVSEGVLSALSKHHVLIREASSLLEVKPVHLAGLERELHRG